MSEQPRTVATIFDRAQAIDSPQERRAYLDDACGTDAELRARVEALLRANEDAGSFLEQPPAGLVATIATGEVETVDDDAGDDPLDFLEASEKPSCLGTLGPYEVIQLLGRGGMGIVLRAYDTKLNRVVAIKVMAPEFSASATAVKRFLREAQAAAAISHDHVVTIFAIHEEHRPPFIVMECVAGQSLQEKIDQQGPLELKEILRIGLQAARGLAAAHEQGLVHRDIKPANILLENGIERVKITDFGLARTIDDVSVTQTGQIAGTPQFMSPEQAQGEVLDSRSDLFSLGSVLYTMCTGGPPFRADSTVAMLRRVTDDEPRPIQELNPEIPDWLAAIIRKLLAKDPAARFQQAEEVAELLGGHLAHQQQPHSATQPPPIEAPPQPTPSSADRETLRGRTRLVSRPLAVVSLTLMVCALVGLIVCLIFFVRTNYGRIQLEANDPNTTFTIDNEMGVGLNNADSCTLTVRAGEHTLRIVQGEVEFETDAFFVDRGEEVLVRVEFIDGKLGARLVRSETRDTEPGTVTTYPEQVIGLQRSSDTLVAATAVNAQADTVVSQSNFAHVDLQPTANQELTAAFHGNPDNDLRELPQGEQVLDGVSFLIGEKLLHLGGVRGIEFPERVDEVTIYGYCSQLHFLHATAFGSPPDDVKVGTRIGRYEIHYQDGTQGTVLIAYGRDVRDWWNDDHGATTDRGRLAWTGSNPANQGYQNSGLRLYHSSWENPYPEKRILCSHHPGDLGPARVAVMFPADLADPAGKSALTNRSNSLEFVRSGGYWRPVCVDPTRIWQRWHDRAHPIPQMANWRSSEFFGSAVPAAWEHSGASSTVTAR